MKNKTIVNKANTTVFFHETPREYLKEKECAVVLD